MIVIKVTKIEIDNKPANVFVGYLEYFNITGRRIYSKDISKAIRFNNKQSCPVSNGQIEIINGCSFGNLPVEKWKYEIVNVK